MYLRNSIVRRKSWYVPALMVPRKVSHAAHRAVDCILTDFVVHESSWYEEKLAMQGFAS
jgi:hypothetical protein